MTIGGVAVSAAGRSNSGSLVVGEAHSDQLLGDIGISVRATNAVLSVQLMHAGRQTSSRETSFPIIAASAHPCSYYREMPRAASSADITEVILDFVGAARGAERAGAHIVEVHAAHGYFLSGFLSRATNFRDDEYGGTLDNRFRILREVVESVTAAISIPVGIRINVHEQSPLGISTNEVIEGLKPIAGLLAYVSVSAGMYALEGDLIIPRRALGANLWRDQARALRAALSIPLLLAGNIESVGDADELIRDGYADLVLLGRSLLADPLICMKSVESTSSPIQPCTELYLCKYHSRSATNLYCPHNPFLRIPELLPKVTKTSDS